MSLPRQPELPTHLIIAHDGFSSCRGRFRLKENFLDV